jgi:hypothetical protein
MPLYLSAHHYTAPHSHYNVKYDWRKTRQPPPPTPCRAPSRSHVKHGQPLYSNIDARLINELREHGLSLSPLYLSRHSWQIVGFSIHSPLSPPQYAPTCTSKYFFFSKMITGLSIHPYVGLLKILSIPPVLITHCHHPSIL